MIIAMKDSKNRQRNNTSSPERKQLISEIDLTDYEGQEIPLVQRFLDCDLTKKDLSDSKSARAILGLGMPEVRAIYNRLKINANISQNGGNIKTFRQYIEWYRQTCNRNGSYGAHVDMQKCLYSSQLTAKVIALIRLASIQMGQPI